MPRHAVFIESIHSITTQAGTTQCVEKSYELNNHQVQITLSTAKLLTSPNTTAPRETWFNERPSHNNSS